MATTGRETVLEKLAACVADTPVFDQVQRSGDSLRCRPKGVESEVYYQISLVGDGRAWVGLYTPDRWLSESIEAELMHQGDKIEELLEEELYDQGYESQLPVEHFRDEHMRYVFRSLVPIPDDEDELWTTRLKEVLLAYEAAFRPLGDMTPKDDFA